MNTERLIVGIDLGTTNSLVSVFGNQGAELIRNRHGDYLTPSVVSLLEDNTLVVGKVAKNRQILYPELSLAEFKRYMGSDKTFSLNGTAFTPVELSALVLGSLKADAEAHLGQPVAEAIITVPAYFNNRQREATRQAAELAGLKVERLINEPSAAALAYGLNEAQNLDSTYIVLDMGGGTLDISLIEVFDGVFEIHACAGDNYLGGLDFTQALLDDIKAHPDFADLDQSLATLERLTHFAETIKQALSEQDFVSQSIDIAGRERTYTLNSKGFEALVTPLLQRVKKPLLQVVRDADIDADDIDGVILVGGATRMKVLHRQVARLFGNIPLSSYQPDQAIAMGAAIQGALKARKQEVKDVVVTDVCPYTLGVKCRNGNGDLVFSPIIERNTTIPVSRTRSFSAAYPGQEDVVIEVYQGESIRPQDNVYIGQYSLALPKHDQLEGLLVTFTYNIDGVLEVVTTIESTGMQAKAYFEKDGLLADQASIEASFAKLAGLKILPRDKEANIHFLSELERLFAESLGDFRSQVAQSIDAFSAALGSHDEQQIDQSRAAIRQALGL
ncbi:Hsp70 family protein [Gallaecimonas xiamenensis]|uniref:2-alkenal reductase n=1 Tax=Gallaecimonas xiamenensis 3-C-1 TaxID=745411 RepID=K2JF76_9GAMM|nr:Hsp70 family protein [Gallaecimonas xiamenensis]EKE73748.1 2-alkenal reductase [Gallaecimonas xiamenensis 3-C-1]